MLLTVIFFLCGALLGITVLRIVGAPLTAEEQIVWGVPIGAILLSWWIFILANFLPFQSWAILAGFGSLIFILILCAKAAHSFFRDMRAAFKTRLRSPSEYVPWLLVLLPWLIYAYFTVPGLMFFRDGALIAGWINTWGDWAAHLRTSTFFASSPSLSLESPLMSGTRFSYPYLSSYLSAILQQLGLSPDKSLTVPTFIFFATLPGVLYTFARRITLRRRTGVLFAYIVLLAGGMGVIYLAQDLFNGIYFWEASPYSPKLYTDIRVNGHYHNSGIWFMNFIISEFFPQRAFLAGLPIALYVVYSVWIALEHLCNGKNHSGKRNLLFSGFLMGILPLVHTHSFLAVAVVSALLTFCMTAKHLVILPILQYDARTVIKKWRTGLSFICRLTGQMLYFLTPAIIVGLVMLYAFVINPDKGVSFFSYLSWWVPDHNMPFNPIMYWLRNAGPLLVLGIAAAFLFPKGRPVYPFLVAGAGIFILGNFIKFQPWHYDNLKILTYWYIAWALPVAVLLADIPFRKWYAFFTFAVLSILLAGAGVADILAVTTSTRTGLPLADRNGVAFAQRVKEATVDEPYAVLASGTSHDHPISLLSGRPLYMGYEGWLWTYGVEYHDRLANLRLIYAVSPESADILQQNNIRYIVLGPQERHQFSPNEQELLSRFPVVMEHGSYKLLKIP